MTTTALQLVCACRGCTFPANRKRQNTAYVDEDSNWADLCAEHQAEADDYWRERWDDYYGGLIGPEYHF